MEIKCVRLLDYSIHDGADMCKLHKTPQIMIEKKHYNKRIKRQLTSPVSVIMFQRAFTHQLDNNNKNIILACKHKKKYKF